MNFVPGNPIEKQSFGFLKKRKVAHYLSSQSWPDGASFNRCRLPSADSIIGVKRNDFEVNRIRLLRLRLGLIWIFFVINL
jgi:hypothetical protein